MILRNCSTTPVGTPTVKHVSFQEKIDRVAVDGTVDHAFLKKARSFEVGSCLEFDFGLCRIADLHSSFDDGSSGVEVVEVEVEEEEERGHMMVSSYKKFAPRSQLQYIKRASI